MRGFKFKYFKQPMQSAKFTNVKCQVCGAGDYCLDGEYFDCDNVVSVCLNCLSEGKQVVKIPEFVKKRLEQHLHEYYKSDFKFKINSKVEEFMEELRKNPPVPWIQYNDWQVCCGDFVEYIGEWEQADINKYAPDANGKEYIISVLEPFSRDKVSDIDEFWEEIGYNTIVFTFKCLKCSRIIAVCQSY